VASRAAGRLRVAPRALARRFLRMQRRERPAAPRRILVAHHLLLGDTLMLTPLLAKLRMLHRDAEIVMTVQRTIAPLYAGRPYGVEAIAYEPRDSRTLDALLDGGGFDLAIVPGDNRYAWLAAAAGARWIVAHDGDRPGFKSWPVDERKPFPRLPTAWGDAVAQLADGPPPQAYRPTDWPAPHWAPFHAPAGDYCVIHVGAGTPLRRWSPERWLAVAEELARRGMEVVWSAGRGEESEVGAADSLGRFRSYAGKLDLPQLWHLVKGARLFLSGDTGVAHLGRVVGTPAVTLYGPGSPRLFGPGEFWRDSPCRTVATDPFPCRDQRVIFKREIEWVRRCQRTLAECPAPRCLHSIGITDVTRAAQELLELPR